MHYNNERVFRDSWPTFKEAGRRTGVYLSGTAPETASDSTQAFSLMIASGRISDIVLGQREDMNKYGVEGAFLPLDDLIEKHAPNIKKLFNERPGLKKQIAASDGNIYYLPYIFHGKASTGWFIRKDWLDKFGLDYPKTVDELYNTYKTFLEKDANGNGLRDEVPFFTRDNNFNVEMLYPLFGMIKEFQVDENGNVYYTPYEEKYKSVISSIAKWYSEGLIDREIFTRGSNARDILLGDNVGGSTHDWFSSTGQFNDKLKDQIPDFSFQPFLPPINVDGVSVEEGSRVEAQTRGWGISKDNKNVIETIKYFDFWYSDEGILLNSFGIEGVHYDMVDGNPIFRDEIIHGSEATNLIKWKNGFHLDIGTIMHPDDEKQWTNEIAQKGIDKYNNSNVIANQFPPLSFTPDEEKIINERFAAIDTLKRETIMKWVMGREDIEASFTAFRKALEKMGIQEVISAYDSAYKRYISQ